MTFTSRPAATLLSFCLAALALTACGGGSDAGPAGSGDTGMPPATAATS